MFSGRKKEIAVSDAPLMFLGIGLIVLAVLMVVVTALLVRWQP